MFNVGDTVMKTCPICEEGTLKDIVEITDGIRLYYSVCSHCGSEQADARQVSLNRNEIRLKTNIFNLQSYKE